MSNEPLSRRGTAIAFLAYLGFVVYGSLVPFELRPVSLEQAIAFFRHIPYYNLGIVSRADWVSNIVLYVPLGFLACSALFGLRTKTILRFPGIILVLIICLAIAVTVEFTQQWFAPRTVSLNDLLAETIGSGIGILTWTFGRERIAHLRDDFVRGGSASVAAVTVAYAIAYGFLALFPFDFVISLDELDWKLSGNAHGWITAGSCSAPVRCAATLTIEILALAPLGFLLSFLWGRFDPKRLFLSGCLIGLIFETIQLLLASGISQGLSIPTRGLGLILGGAAAWAFVSLGPKTLAGWVWRLTLIAVIPYLVVVSLASGWFSVPALPIHAALARIQQVYWIPLYYHYYTTETVAMTSLLAQMALYAPVGIAVWALGLSHWRYRQLGARTAAFAALVPAVVIEAGKLFFPPNHPDPTNLMIAALTACFVFVMARWLQVVASASLAPQTETGSPRQTGLDDHPSRIPLAETEEHEHSGETPQGRSLNARWADMLATIRRAGRMTPSGITPLNIATGALPLTVAAFGLLSYPVAWPLLALLLIGYGAWLWMRPMVWLLVIPMLLPALDLSAITGRLLLDEFDLFLLVTLGIGWIRIATLPPRRWPNRLFPAALTLLWASWVTSMAQGLWPLTSIGLPILDSSHSPMDTWSVGKGLFWTLLLVPLLRRIPQNDLWQAKKLFEGGIIFGLSVLVLAVLWERQRFGGILNTDHFLPVTATVSSMNTGGAYIEAFIAFGVPFLVVWTALTDGRLRKLLGSFFIILSIYGMLVTFSAAGLIALIVGLLATVMGLLRRTTLHWSGRGWIALATFTALILSITAAILSSGAGTQRHTIVQNDLRQHLSHWQHALGLATTTSAGWIFGSGFGQYPSIDLLSSAGERPSGAFSIVDDGDDPFLRLGTGQTLFLDQKIQPQGTHPLRLTLRIREQPTRAQLNLSVCKKALLYAVSCDQVEIAQITNKLGWRKESVELKPENLDSEKNSPYRPLTLSMYASGEVGWVDVDDISLIEEDGRELIANGGFDKGAKRWLLTSNERFRFHIEQQWIEIFFAQGLLGLLALLAILTLCLKPIFNDFSNGRHFSVALLAGLAAMLTVGLFGSIADTSKTSMLLSLGLFALLISDSRRPRKRRRPE